MPTIKLKPNSPDFDNGSSKGANDQATDTLCDMPGCDNQGEYRAPKHRGLNEYHEFCLEHVREYNKAWNFFEGMNETEVREQILKDWYGDRPTWKYRDFDNLEESLYQKSQIFRDGHAPDGKSKGDSHYVPEALRGTPEMEALAFLGLAPPVTFDEVKKQYKQLVKKYHPDFNPNDSAAEEKIKKINMSYTLLKVAFASYEDLQRA